MRTTATIQFNFKFFFNLDTDRSDLTQKILSTFDKLKKSTKFETVQIHCFNDFFEFLSSGNFATMATWRNNFFSLLQEESLEGQT